MAVATRSTVNTDAVKEAGGGPLIDPATFEEIIAGTPATVSIVVQGCMRGGTCEILDTYTTVANADRSPSLTKVYDYFAVTPSWTGGTSPSVTVSADAVAPTLTPDTVRPCTRTTSDPLPRPPPAGNPAGAACPLRSGVLARRRLDAQAQPARPLAGRAQGDRCQRRRAGFGGGALERSALGARPRGPLRPFDDRLCAGPGARARPALLRPSGCSSCSTGSRKCTCAPKTSTKAATLLIAVR